MSKILIPALLLLVSCHSGQNRVSPETARREIMETERDFEKMAASRGLAEAFFFYADSAATISRDNILLHGKDSIRRFYADPKYAEVQLKWTPDFAGISVSGDLGYTYGKYTYTTHDSAGQIITSKGFFHTVWKKQTGGNWRYVWD